MESETLLKSSVTTPLRGRSLLANSRYSSTDSSLSSSGSTSPDLNASVGKLRLGPSSSTSTMSTNSTRDRARAQSQPGRESGDNEEQPVIPTALALPMCDDEVTRPGGLNRRRRRSLRRYSDDGLALSSSLGQTSPSSRIGSPESASGQEEPQVVLDLSEIPSPVSLRRRSDPPPEVIEIDGEGASSSTASGTGQGQNNTTSRRSRKRAREGDKPMAETHMRDRAQTRVMSHAGTVTSL
ncbi:unnamed protein product, partial [Discosporangium mesarthrocarpum]